MNQTAGQVIQWTLWGIAMAIIFYFIRKSRAKDLKVNNDNKLSLPGYVLIIGIIDFVFFLGIALISNIFSNGTESVGTTMIFMGFSFLGLFLIYFYFIQKFSYDIDEINYTRFSGKKIKILWSEISSVTYQASMQWFLIKSQNGEKSYYSIILKGIRPFSEIILKNVANDKIDKKTLEILKRIIKGEVI